MTWAYRKILTYGKASAGHMEGANRVVGGKVDLVIRKSGYRLAFCVGVFLVRGCSVGIYPLGADSSLETREGRCESCLNLAATAWKI